MEAKPPPPPASSPAPEKTVPSTPPKPPIETPAEAPRRKGGAGKRKAAAASASPAGGHTTPSKRFMRERSAAISQYVIPQLFNGPCTRARQSTPNTHSAATADAPRKLSESFLAPAAAPYGAGKEGSVPVKVIEICGEETAEEPVIDSEFEAIRTRAVGVHVVPTPAGWFSWEKIHPIEEYTLGSFFNRKSDSRSPETYMEIRNYIMKKFHADPQAHLEIKVLEELDVGDMDARQEVMEFLDHWGLINFHPFPPLDRDPVVTDANNAPNTSKVDNQSSLVDKLFRFETVTPIPSPVSQKPNLVQHPPPSATPNILPEPMIIEEAIKSNGPSVEYHCNSCSADCSRRRYHCQKQADFDLCTECYNNGKFGSGMSPTDFILMEPAEVPGVSSGSWTDQETLLLLEAFELFGENFNEITEHVATKTKAQCILHFLQMSIEDTFMGSDNEVDDNVLEETECGSVNEDSAALSSLNLMEVDNKGGEEDVENKDQATSAQTNDSENKNSEAYVTHQTDNDVAVGILKSAFQVTGCSSEGELLSFAEAGNPVMVLAAFLAGLVGTDVALSASRRSLKAMLEDSPSLQLATRHCFVLEDPPPTDSATTNMDGANIIVDGETSTRGKTDELYDSTTKNEENTRVPTERMDDMVNSTVKHEQIHVSEEDQDETKEKIEDLPSNTIVPNEQSSSNTKKVTNESAASEVLALSNVNEPADSTRENEIAFSIPMEVDDIDLADGNKQNALEAGDASASTGMKEYCDTPQIVDAVSPLATLEGQESQQTFASGSSEKDKDKEDVDDKNISPENRENTSVENNRENEYVESDSNQIDRLRRAAVTALSAATIKAKLLAKEEEDQILQCVSQVIEKQLRKLEIKLSFFSDVESVVLRMREQTEKARQRLFQERAQIIAARLGLPSSSARGSLSSLPINKLAMNYSASARPPNMITSRPLKRP